MTNSELMDAAKARLKGQWGYVAVATLIYSIIIGSISNSFRITQHLEFALTLTIIVAGPITLGYTIYIAKVVNKENAALEDLFSGFHHFLNSFLVYVISLIFVFLWTMLFIIPGFIAAIRYSMVYLIMKDNPEMKAMDAINESCRLMDGHKMDYFCLQLRFIGWVILCIMTLGIGFILLQPYVQATTTLFYQQLKGEDINDEDNDNNDTETASNGYDFKFNNGNSNEVTPSNE